MSALAVYADVVRYRDLFANLFRRDLQAKYRGSALGVLWTVANPVMLMGVYLLVFGVVWKSPFSNGGHYALFLLAGLAPWTFFAAALQSSTRSMLDNANLIRKTRFPRQLVPLSVVAAHLVSFGVMLVLLLVVNFVVLPRARRRNGSRFRSPRCSLRSSPGSRSRSRRSTSSSATSSSSSRRCSCRGSS